MVTGERFEDENGTAITSIRVLVLEDNGLDAELLLDQLRSDHFAPEAHRVWTREDFVAALDDRFDLILADYTLPRFDALEAVKLLRQSHRDVPFIVVTGAVGEERAVECMREGATDYLLKDRLARLGHAVRRALVDQKRRLAKRAADEEIEKLKRQLEAERDYLRDEIESAYDFEGIVGESPALQRVLEAVELVARTEATVLILGETGTGKELVARAVHAASRRSRRSLVKVNCSALARTLIENELFGHAAGAYTGAVGKGRGRFELAHQGTIFLDEIGELPLEAQAKLLRVLQSGEIQRLGESETIEVDVRIIAATNRDLEAEVAAGRFRADLYYRLNVFPLLVPPLRDRPGDVAMLARHFARRFARKHGCPQLRLDDDALAALAAYGWPGNVRELENLIERAVIIGGGSGIPIRDLLPRARLSNVGGADSPEALPFERSLLTLDQVQRDHIERVLDETRGRVEGPRGAATILGVNPNTLRSRMRKLGIRPVRSRPEASS